jgi:hypothetical protein
MDDTWSPKTISESNQKALDDLLEKTKDARVTLDGIGSEMAGVNCPPINNLLGWARLSCSAGNRLRTVMAQLVAIVRNEEANRYMAIKLECDQKDYKFTDGAAKMDASKYIGKYRMARNIIEAYVTNSDNIIKVCNMHLQNIRQNQISDIN